MFGKDFIYYWTPDCQSVCVLDTIWRTGYCPSSQDQCCIIVTSTRNYLPARRDTIRTQVLCTIKPIHSSLINVLPTPHLSTSQMTTCSTPSARGYFIDTLSASLPVTYRMNAIPSPGSAGGRRQPASQTPRGWHLPALAQCNFASSSKWPREFKQFRHLQKQRILRSTLGLLE